MLFFPDYPKSKIPTREFFFTVSMLCPTPPESQSISAGGNSLWPTALLEAGEIQMFMAHGIDHQHSHARVAECRDTYCHPQAAEVSQGCEEALRRDDPRTVRRLLGKHSPLQ